MRARSERTRRRLVGAGAEMFIRNGCANAALGQTAGAAGTTKGALHFPLASEEGRAEAVQERGRAMLQEFVGELRRGGVPPVQTLIDTTHRPARTPHKDPVARAGFRITAECGSMRPARHGHPPDVDPRGPATARPGTRDGGVAYGRGAGRGGPRDAAGSHCPQHRGPVRNRHSPRPTQPQSGGVVGNAAAGPGPARARDPLPGRPSPVAVRIGARAPRVQRRMTTSSLCPGTTGAAPAPPATAVALRTRTTTWLFRSPGTDSLEYPHVQ